MARRMNGYWNMNRRRAASQAVERARRVVELLGRRADGEHDVGDGGLERVGELEQPASMFGLRLALR